MGILSQHGYEMTPRADEADVLIVNTCSFIAPAQQESVDTILEMAEHKVYGRAKRLVVTGCLVERYREQILEQIPAVDAVIGTGELEKIVEAVEGRARDGEAAEGNGAKLPRTPTSPITERADAPGGSLPAAPDLRLLDPGLLDLVCRILVRWIFRHWIFRHWNFAR